MSKMASATIILLVAAVFVQQCGSEDLYWAHNTNWDEPSNWGQNRMPCGRDTVKLPNNVVTYINDDISVGSIILPEDGVIYLKPSVTIRLDEDSECEVPSGTEPMAADVKENDFLPPTQRWECAENWLTKDNFPAKHSPCGDDNAIFQTGSTFAVTSNSNESITVRSITVRGSKITSPKAQLEPKEFNLDISIEPKCAENPVWCPCAPDKGCPKVYPGPVNPQAQDKRNLTGIAVGTVVVAVLLLMVVALTIIAVVLYCRHKRTGGYVKDDLLEDPMGHESDDITQEQRDNRKKSSKTSTTNSSAFDNPVYDSGILNLDESEMIGYETKLSSEEDKEQVFKASLDDYQLSGGAIKPTLEFNGDVIDDTAAEDDSDGKKPAALYVYEKL